MDILTFLQRARDVHVLEPASQRSELRAEASFISWQQSVGGASIYGGALRLFGTQHNAELPPMQEWNSDTGWRSAFTTKRDLPVFFGEDAFGVQFSISQNQNILRFFPDVGKSEDLGINLSEFFDAIVEDPDATLSLSFYLQCTQKFGVPRLNEHFAFIVELSVGGSLSIENVEVVPAATHMRAAAQIANQVGDDKVGTLYRPPNTSGRR
jgi:hypothetical protein